MSRSPDRPSRKRLATRQLISDAATVLFIERGFDKVTVDDIAKAAEVGRMTVFNHFTRKEDMFFDRDEEAHELLRAALRDGAAGVAPVEVLGQLAPRLVADHHPVVEFSSRSRSFVEAIQASETLKARARAIRDELAVSLAAALAKAAGREPADPDAQLMADLFLATWTAAFAHAHRVFRTGSNAKKAEAAFLETVAKGTKAARAAGEGTPYVDVKPTLSPKPRRQAGR